MLQNLGPMECVYIRLDNITMCYNNWKYFYWERVKSRQVMPNHLDVLPALP